TQVSGDPVPTSRGASTSHRPLTVILSAYWSDGTTVFSTPLETANGVFATYCDMRWPWSSDTRRRSTTRPHAQKRTPSKSDRAFFRAIVFRHPSRSSLVRGTAGSSTYSSFSVKHAPAATCVSPRCPTRLSRAPHSGERL